MRIFDLKALATVVVALVVGASCSTQKPMQLAPPNGYLLLNEEGAAVYGIPQSDTVLEVKADSIPRRVLEASELLARELQKDAKCSRFFATNDRYLVLLASTCQANKYLEDGLALAGFRENGDSIGRRTAWPSNFVRTVEPASRKQ